MLQFFLWFEFFAAILIYKIYKRNILKII